MYRVIIKVGGHVRNREFNSLAEAKKFYYAVRKNNKNCWLLDLTEKPQDAKLGTVRKVLNMLDKISGRG